MSHHGSYQTGGKLPAACFELETVLNFIIAFFCLTADCHSIGLNFTLGLALKDIIQNFLTSLKRNWKKSIQKGLLRGVSFKTLYFSNMLLYRHYIYHTTNSEPLYRLIALSLSVLVRCYVKKNLPQVSMTSTITTRLLQRNSW